MNWFKLKIALFVRYRSKIYLGLTASIIIVLALTLWASHTVENASSEFITDDINNVPAMKVGLLLGTSKSLANNQPNDFFYNRIKAAVELFKAGKIKCIIVSGDNSEIYYNEPIQMKKALVKEGIPDSVIYLDYAGFRTFDSVVRAKEIFGQTSFVIISQKFHNERAVFIARRLNINAFGYNAKDVGAYNGFRTKLREYFARDKVYLDFLFGVKPKFLGEKIKIG